MHKRGTIHLHGTVELVTSGQTPGNVDPDVGEETDWIARRGDHHVAVWTELEREDVLFEVAGSGDERRGPDDVRRSLVVEKYVEERVGVGVADDWIGMAVIELPEGAS